MHSIFLPQCFVFQTFWSRKKSHTILKAFVYNFVEYVTKEIKFMKPSIGGIADNVSKWFLKQACLTLNTF